MLKICERCGKEFNGRRSTSKYCSEECQHVSHIKRVTLICAHCGKEFEVKPEEAKNGRKYCSHECADAANGIKKRIWKTDSICPICGETFTVGYKWQEYCSIQCHAKSREERVILVCETCGKSFQVRPCIAKGGQRYCSPKCRGVASGITQSKKVERTCLTCGKVFYVIPARVESGEGLYCSMNCYNRSKTGENSHFWQGGKQTQETCPICGKIFTTWITENSHRIYCSRECHAKAQTFPDELKIYPSAFNDDLKEFIRDRDGRECLVCGSSELDTAHPVHHINYVKLDNVTSNLVSLCLSCHGRTNTNRSYWQTRLSSLMATLGYYNT